MLLARKGYRVLMVDRAGFPSDTVSTHMIHAPGVAALRRWGVLDLVVATGCPPIDTYSFDFGPFTLSGRPHAVDGVSSAYAPRRTVLDKILVDAAVDAGVEMREHFTVEDVVFDDGAVVGIRGHGAGGSTVCERARVVVGADGRNSRIAKAVEPHHYNDKPMLLWGYYTYWSDLPTNGFETIIRPDRGWAAAPTNDGLTMVVVGWPAAQAAAYKSDVEANYLQTLELAPEFAERVSRATRVERFTGGGVPNFFRTPFGPGWALVGDAGYIRDPVTAQGISDAFRDAELCAAALDQAFTGTRPFDEAMASYQQRSRRTRAADVRVHHPAGDTRAAATRDAASARRRARQPGRDGPVRQRRRRMLSPAEFFAPDNVAQIMAADSPVLAVEGRDAWSSHGRRRCARSSKTLCPLEHHSAPEAPEPVPCPRRGAARGHT